MDGDVKTNVKSGGGSAQSDGGDGGEAKMSAREEIVDLGKTVLWAVGIALILRIIVFQPFNIPSGSMKPNLLIGDFLFVSKPSYGYSRASLVWPLTRLDVDGRFLGREPARGEVMVFKNRKDANKDYIKRLVGMPGDKIQIVEGVLHINDDPVRKEFLGLEAGYCDGAPDAAVPAYRETLPEGVSYKVIECAGDRGRLDNVGPYLVPEGHYFMMGDNRDQSQDSRVQSQVGYVGYDDIVGRAERLFFSFDGATAQFWEVWKWPFAIRYGRLLNEIK
ncbi:MAG: signal peptidase I [Parvularculaceae bacterium]